MTKDEHRHDILWKSNSWHLYVTERTLPDGSLHESAYIDHPGSVVIVPWKDTNQGGEILMLRQYRHTLRDSILELPAGTRKWGEDLLVCAQRELREETGFNAGEFVHLGQFWPSPGITNESMNLYLARRLQYDPLPKDIDEEIELITYNFHDLLAMAVDGRLQDAKSVIGVLKTAFYLHQIPFD
ncbi:MAG: NUDIX hydrolase [Candidatus Promineifilaceae bacterium]|jgi:ADP-ribose pyrophosphatase